MIAIFLDIDGVLLPFGAAEGGRASTAEKRTFRPEALNALATILREIDGATLVLSSTWRCGGGAEEVLRQFQAWGGGGALGAMSHFEHTTSLTMHSHRAWEIAAWLKDPTSPAVSAWIALDDEPLLDDGVEGSALARYGALFAGHVVQTESSTGLTADDAAQAIRLLRAT
tara:strand:+ start:83 stop:592 length:510 start_codon:yes stop_codon:yes gene_type:complete